MSDTGAAPAEGRVTSEKRGHILLMGIDRPQKLNGLTPVMFEQLTTHYETLEADDELRVGILFAHGQHFTAGLDLPSFQERFRSGRDFAAADKLDIYDRWGVRRTKPIVCAVKGITYTAGIEMMLAADIVIAADDCRLSQLEPKRGLVAVGGATWRFVERAGWGNAMRLLLTSMEFDAAEALRVGLVQEVVPAGQELDRAVAIAEQICAGAPLAVRATLANARTYLLEGEEAAAAQLTRISREMGATEDFKEGVQSFIEKREAKFQGR